jgi:hypothetical protein
MITNQKAVVSEVSCYPMFTIKCKFRSNPTRDPRNYQHNCNSYCEAPRLQAQHVQLQQYSMARVYSAPVWIWFSVSSLRHSIGSLKLKQNIACNECRTKNVTIHVHNWTCFFELSWMQKVNVYSIVSFKKIKRISIACDCLLPKISLKPVTGFTMKLWLSAQRRCYKYTTDASSPKGHPVTSIL